MSNSLREIELIIAGYETLAKTKIDDGWVGYFLNFMFRQLPGSTETKFTIMQDEVSRVYTTFLPSVVRRPKSRSWSLYNPIFIGCPDNQVAKKDRRAAEARINDGWHFNGLMLTPPEPVTRFNEHLGNHFATYRDRYVRPCDRLDRIDVTLVEEGTMIDYAFKHMKRGHISADDILLLPKTIDELSSSAFYKGESNDVVRTYLTGPSWHPGYQVVDRLDKTWKGETADFDPHLAGQPEMSLVQLEALIRALKVMRKECRRAIDQLEECRQATERRGRKRLPKS